ncbi:MAG: protein kinase [Planctomycetes bacterium]|nr:protein kinase [Planctomycetota bacterium]
MRAAQFLFEVSRFAEKPKGEEVSVNCPIEGYRFKSYLGGGGFGKVFKATGPGGIEVAIKVIDLGERKGFKELRALQRLKKVQHPNLIPLFAFWLLDEDLQVLGTDESINEDPSEESRSSIRNTVEIQARSQKASCLVIAMGLGHLSLEERLEECKVAGESDKIPPGELLDYMDQAAAAIDYLNGPTCNIIHCDVKPSNIMIVGGVVQICDMGLARALDDVRTSSLAASPAYASPEYLDGQRPSGSSDQYSLAISYFELRTGDLPFAEDVTSPVKVALAHTLGQLELKLLATKERRVVAKATSLDPADRFKSTAEMVRALRAACPLEPAEPEDPNRWREIGHGYRLRERLQQRPGEEVWEAEAPGGGPSTIIIRNWDTSRSLSDLAALGLVQSTRHENICDVQAHWLLDEDGDVLSFDEAKRTSGAPPHRVVVAERRSGGVTLAARLGECKGGGIAHQELLGYMPQMAAAVDFLNQRQHDVGGKKAAVQHVDLCPENFVLVGDTVRLADFANARVLFGSRVAVDPSLAAQAASAAAPEVFGGQITLYTDQYALAATYVELRTGRRAGGDAPSDDWKSPGAAPSSLPSSLPPNDVTGAAARAKKQSSKTLAAPRQIDQQTRIEQGEVRDTEIIQDTRESDGDFPVPIPSPAQVWDLGGLDEAEAHVIRKATSTKPKHRYRSCHDFVEALHVACEYEPPAVVAPPVEVKKSSLLKQLVVMSFCLLLLGGAGAAVYEAYQRIADSDDNELQYKEKLLQLEHEIQHETEDKNDGGYREAMLLLQNEENKEWLRDSDEARLDEEIRIAWKTVITAKWGQIRIEPGAVIDVNNSTATDLYLALQVRCKEFLNQFENDSDSTVKDIAAEIASQIPHGALEFIFSGEAKLARNDKIQESVNDFHKAKDELEQDANAPLALRTLLGLARARARLAQRDESKREELAVALRDLERALSALADPGKQKLDPPESVIQTVIDILTPLQEEREPENNARLETFATLYNAALIQDAVELKESKLKGVAWEQEQLAGLLRELADQQFKQDKEKEYEDAAKIYRDAAKLASAAEELSQLASTADILRNPAGFLVRLSVKIAGIDSDDPQAVKKAEKEVSSAVEDIAKTYYGLVSAKLADAAIESKNLKQLEPAILLVKQLASNDPQKPIYRNHAELLISKIAILAGTAETIRDFEELKKECQAFRELDARYAFDKLSNSLVDYYYAEAVVETTKKGDERPIKQALDQLPRTERGGDEESYQLYVRARCRQRLANALQKTEDINRLAELLSDKKQILGGSSKQRAKNTIAILVEEAKALRRSDSSISLSEVIKTPYNSRADENANRAYKLVQAARSLFERAGANPTGEDLDLDLEYVFAEKWHSVPSGHQNDLLGVAMEGLLGEETPSTLTKIDRLRVQYIYASPENRSGRRRIDHRVMLACYLNVLGATRGKANDEKKAIDLSKFVIGPAIQVARTLQRDGSEKIGPVLAEFYGSAGDLLLTHARSRKSWKEGAWGLESSSQSFMEGAIDMYSGAIELLDDQTEKKAKAKYYLNRGRARTKTRGKLVEYEKIRADAKLARELGGDRRTAAYLDGEAYLNESREQLDRKQRVKLLKQARDSFDQAIPEPLVTARGQAEFLIGRAATYLDLGNFDKESKQERAWQVYFEKSRDAAMKATEDEDGKHKDWAFQALGHALEDLAYFAHVNRQTNFSSSVKSFDKAISENRYDLQHKLDRGRCQLRWAERTDDDVERNRLVGKAIIDLEDAFNGLLGESKAEAALWHARALRLQAISKDAGEVEMARVDQLVDKNFADSILQLANGTPGRWRCLLDRAEEAQRRYSRKHRDKISNDKNNANALKYADGLIKEMQESGEDYKGTQFYVAAQRVRAKVHRRNGDLSKAIEAYRAALPGTDVLENSDVDLPVHYFRALIEVVAYPALHIEKTNDDGTNGKDEWRKHHLWYRAASKAAWRIAEQCNDESSPRRKFDAKLAEADTWSCDILWGKQGGDKPTVAEKVAIHVNILKNIESAMVFVAGKKEFLRELNMGNREFAFRTNYAWVFYTTASRDPEQAEQVRRHRQPLLEAKAKAVEWLKARKKNDLIRPDEANWLNYLAPGSTE